VKRGDAAAEKRHVKPLPKLNQHGKHESCNERSGQDTKAYNRTLEKQELTKNETSLKGWFCLDMSTSTNVTAGQAVRCNLYVFKKNIKDLASILHAAHFKQYCFR
jgi:hypothetical protein